MSTPGFFVNFFLICASPIRCQSRFSYDEIANILSSSLSLFTPPFEVSSSFSSSSSAKDSFDVLSFFLAFLTLAAEALCRVVQSTEQIASSTNARFF